MGCCWWRGGLGGASGVILLLYSTCLILPVGSKQKCYEGYVGGYSPPTPADLGTRRDDPAAPRSDAFCAYVGQHVDQRGLRPHTIGGNLNRINDPEPLNVIAYHWRYGELPTRAVASWNFWENWIEGERATTIALEIPKNRFTCKLDPGTGDKTCKKDGGGVTGYDFIWENIKTAYVEFCPDNVKIRAYLVKQHGRVLKGWLHFEVEMADGDTMDYVIIQMRDENMNFVGEFVTEEDEQCGTTNSQSNLVKPTKYQVLPCSAVGLREAKVSNSILMANEDSLVNGSYLVEKGFIRKGNIGKGIHFNWRLNEYWCNRHLRFKLEAYVWTKKNKDYKKDSKCDKQNTDKNCRIKRVTTAYWIYPKWFGAADVKLPGNLDCTVQAINFTTGDVNVNKEANDSWIKIKTPRESELKYRDDILGQQTDTPPHHTPLPHRTIGCEDLTDSKYTRSFGDARSFGGRCENVTTKNPFTQNLHGCSNPNSEEENKSLNLTSYTEYSEFIYGKRIVQCNHPCELPNITNPDHLAEIKSYPRGNRSEISKNRKPKILINTLVNSRQSVRDTTFWQTRKFHGSLCIFLILFLIPISNFFSRYYKETFMHSRGLGCAPWFWFHLFVCFAVPILLWCSYSAMTQTINSFGRSTSSEAVFHKIFGRVFATGFILMICLGGLRPVQPHLRLVCMALHSVVGFTLYIFGIILIVTSTYIPSSPSLADCDKDNGLPIGFSFTATMTLAWLVIDILFHVLLTILQFVTDRRYEIKRAGCGLPFVPILPAISPYSRADLVGTRFRKVVLLLYVIIAATMTYVTIAELFRKDRIEHCILGNMTCDLTETSPNKASSPFGCDAFALKYYSSVYNKYNLRNE